MPAQQDQRFCGHCGTALPAGLAVAVADAAEHRLITVIFSDVVDSTRLTETYGAEVFREMLREYRELAARCFRRYDGTVASYFGDGTLVYFGYPQAHEDDAKRAVEASLEVQGSLAEVNRLYRQKYDIDLRVRIAVHTGTVVAGDISSETAREEMAIIGNAPNIAARLQALAEAGSVTISDATYRLVGHAFECRPLGSVAVKGLSHTVPIFRVEGPAKRRGRAARDQGTPMVGRDGPLDSLVVAWERARAGGGGTVFISGEAGVGKTRLITELAARMAHRTMRRINWRCSPLHENTALGPLLQDISLVLGFNEARDNGEKLARLERLLKPFQAGSELATLLAPLLDIALPGGGALVAVSSPQRDREQLQSRLVDAFLTLAQERPVLLVVEDVHWADPSTLELLSRVVPRICDAHALVVLTSRTRIAAPWLDQHANFVALTRLDEADTKGLIRLIAEDHGLDEAIVQALVAKTDGVPLFIEEMTQGVIEAERTRPGHVSPQHLTVPSTLQESLAGRIDRVAVDRRVLQLSATLGREFAFDVLAALCPLDPGQLKAELDKLVRASLLYRIEAVNAIRYVFRHALIQDAIYNFQLSGQRQANHQHIAGVLARDFPEVAERSPELVASHYLLSADRAAALPFMQHAADIAIRRSANVEASNHLQKALEIVRLLPRGAERDRTELSLLTALGVVLSARLGFAAEETGAAYAQAREICRGLGREVGLFPVLHGLYRFYFNRAKLGTASELSCEMLGVARYVGDPALLLEGHRAAGNCRFLGGHFTKANRHFDRTMALYRAEQHHVHRFEYGADPFIVAATMGGIAAYLRGEAEQGLALMDQALGAAEELDHPYTVCWALSLGCVLYQIDGDRARVAEYSRRQLGLAQRHGFPIWDTSARILLGWSDALEPGGKAAVIPMRASIDLWGRSGAAAYLPYHLSLLTQAYLYHDEPAAAADAVADALRAATDQGELWWESELLRLSGHCVLRQTGDQARAESWFRDALAVASRQQARRLMERARSDLDRLVKA